MSDYLTDGSHVAISGVTGVGRKFGGKSVTANWWQYNAVEKGWYDLSVYFNPKHDDFVKGEAVHSLKGFAESYQAGTRRFDFRPASTSGADEHGRVMEFLNELPDSVLVVHDEAASYADADSLHWATARAGNEADMRSLVIAQRPWDLGESVLANCPLKVWVGPTTPEARRYFQSLQIESAFDLVEQNTGPHMWSVIDGGSYVETNPPVPADFA